ncbi:uncharacterized protein LOC116844027 [Odontomachus brunneus]|uniref:uncharacterized protein LOC116844027 n=1 Tax=Odontomachus brunneus TaxID=486640 RepID=UPI0013F24737|nr:uncharacterized protein LOC116844027 [Odontomachus brunneus]
MKLRLIQVNLNKSWPPYDLLGYHMVENVIALAILSEPPRRRPDAVEWLVSRSGSAAILWRSSHLLRTCTLARQGRDFVAARVGRITVVSCYISPNTTKGQYLEFLDKLGDLIGDVGARILVGRDFNARSASWDSRVTNISGILIEEWAAECELRLVNVGGISTCTNCGYSVVDLTWVSTDLVGLMKDWAVAVDMESLLDHR